MALLSWDGALLMEGRRFRGMVPFSWDGAVLMGWRIPPAARTHAVRSFAVAPVYLWHSRLTSDPCAMAVVAFNVPQGTAALSYAGMILSLFVLILNTSFASEN